MFVSMKNSSSLIRDTVNFHQKTWDACAGLSKRINPISIFANFSQVKKSEETRIVLDCDFDKIETILQQVKPA